MKLPRRNNSPHPDRSLRKTVQVFPTWLRHSLLPLMVLVLSAATPPVAQAVFEGEQHVDARLLSEVTSIEPGVPFTVALELVHDKGWHTYWKYSSTGYATSITWTMPEGFQAGAIEWPVPYTYDAGISIDYIFKETTYLLTVITPPEELQAGTVVTLRALAEWLMCEEVCIPGDASLELALPVSEGKAGMDTSVKALIERERARQAVAPGQAGWQAVAYRSGDEIQLYLVPSPVSSESGAQAPQAVDPRNLYFFTGDGQVVPEAEQRVETSSGGIIRLTLAKKASGPQNAAVLNGVLANAAGWTYTPVDGEKPQATVSRGLRIDSPYVAQLPPRLAGFEPVAELSQTVSPTAAAKSGKSGVAPGAESLSKGASQADGEVASAVPEPADFEEGTAGKEGGNVTATGPTTGAAGSAPSFLGILLLAFAGGLILNLMPCVFPVLGIKVMGFVNQAGEDRQQVTLHGLMFTLGVLVSFWILAGLLIALRAGGQELGWGFQLQSAPFVFVLAVFLFLFALNLSGVFEVGQGLTAVGGKLSSRSGFTGSFFSGVLATVVATPCSAPFLAPALGAALVLSATQSLVVFTFIALGLAAPYLVLSLFPGLTRFLPRPGAWMETFKQLMAFPLYATVVFLLWVQAGQTSDYGLLFTLLSFVGVALAAWIYGRWATANTRRPVKAAAIVVAVLALFLALWLGYPTGTATAYAGSASPANAATGSSSSEGVHWEVWSPEKVEALRAAGRTIYVDFTARWCLTCQTNKAAVFSSERVVDAFVANDIVALKADWTNRDPQITAELARFNRSAVPFNLIYKPGRSEPVVLPEVLTPGIVLNALSDTSDM